MNIILCNPFDMNDSKNVTLIKQAKIKGKANRPTPLLSMNSQNLRHILRE